MFIYIYITYIYRKIAVIVPPDISPYIFIISFSFFSLRGGIFLVQAKTRGS